MPLLLLLTMVTVAAIMNSCLCLCRPEQPSAKYALWVGGQSNMAGDMHLTKMPSSS